MEEFQPILAGRPIVIAGPCSAETERQVLCTAEALARGGVSCFRAGIWKPRTHPGGFDGVGEKGLRWLRRVKDELGMTVATEVANRVHAQRALEAGVDIIWIGARTATNPFAVQEIADTLAELKAKDVAVLVKNPVNPDLELWIGALQRIYEAGVRRLAAVHRGFSLYGGSMYRNDPCWGIPTALHLRYPKLPVICDPSHMGGARTLVAPLSQQAYDLGFDGLMVECHCSPQEAWSDAPQQISPAELLEILKGLEVRSKGDVSETLAQLRSRIDAADNDLLDVLARRMQVSREIGLYKKERGMAVLQAERYNDVIRSRVARGELLGISADFLTTLLLAIHDESVRMQLSVNKEPEQDS
ncbi:MAG: bifunctional 3-deoxy-7-phosphoheptulonate synthase/chorismate mutase type II [Muribaculaceae bacterium]|nr:bifunctional 3-deoxy-7-phosphoheptulonate synthase/chorismate mutase type II [Muribaculaceae bacterium]